MNRHNWLDVLFLTIAVIVVLLSAIKRLKEILHPREIPSFFNFKKRELNRLSSDLQMIEELIDRLSSKRYCKKYGDTINSLRFVRDSIRSKIKKLKGE